MPYALRTFECVDCGKPVNRRRPAGAVVRCPEDAIAYSAEEQRQLANHEGPHWERWKWSWVAGVTRATRTSPHVGVRRVA